MPIKIPSGLPARAILDSERIFALEKPEAERQRVRPLKLVILNLMPKKVETETQLLRLISQIAAAGRNRLHEDIHPRTDPCQSRSSGQVL